MAIKSDTFSSVELTLEDAKRFIKHINEDQVKEQAVTSYQLGRSMLENLTRYGHCKTSGSLKELATHD